MGGNIFMGSSPIKMTKVYISSLHKYIMKTNFTYSSLFEPHYSGYFTPECEVWDLSYNDIEE